MPKALVFLCVLAFAGVAMAQPSGQGCPMGMGMGDGPHRMHGKMFLGKAAKELGLSAEQKAKMENLWKEHRKKMVKLKADLQIAHIDLQDAMTAENVNKGSVDGLCDKIAGMQGQIEKERCHLRIDMMGVLTKDQRQKAKEMKFEQGEKRGKCGRHEKMEK